MLYILIFLICTFLFISLCTSKQTIYEDYSILSYSELTFKQLISNQVPSLQNPLGIIGAFTSYFFTKWFGHLFSFSLLLLIISNLIFKLAHIKFQLLRKLSYISQINIINFYFIYFYYYEYFLSQAKPYNDIQIFNFLYSFTSALLGKIGTPFFIVAVFLISLRFVVSFNPFRIAISFFSSVFKILKRKKRKIILETTDTIIEAKNISSSQPQSENIPTNIISDKITVNDTEKDTLQTAEYQINLTEQIPNVSQEQFSHNSANRTAKSKPLFEDSLEYLKPDVESFLSKPISDKFIDKVKLEEEIKNISQILKDKLMEFGIEANVLNVNVGPIITQYELEPAPGIKVNRFVSLSDDLALALKARSIRVQAPIPGRGLIGIEIPNKLADVIYMRDIFLSSEMHKTDALLSVALGKDIAGRPIVTDLAKMPHLLIAGATGSGKSVCINTIICSLLLRCCPEEVRLVMIDPKRIELSGYEGIPHLIQNVVTDPDDALNTLNWAVYEMERRYELLQEAKVRDLVSFNQKIKEHNKLSDDNEQSILPFIVLVVDEFADLIMTAGREIELPIARLAQMARAVGIHLILATQRPSIKVITGVIKANFPARIAFRVSSKVDSRVILDSTGADKLLGRGDMLFLPPGKANPERIHGAFLSDSEIEGLVEYLRTQPKPKLDIIMNKPDEININDFEYDDELFPESAKLVVSTNTASVSMLQRHFKIGYARAGRLIDLLEQAGIIGPHVGSKSREVLMSKEDIDAFYEKIHS